MNGADVIRSYLVGLGFDIDMSSYNKFNRALEDTERKVTQHTAALASSYVKAGTIIASSLAAIGFATVGLLDKIASADLEYQKFAMHMFLGRDAAKEMKIATDALGESLEDIAWMPELREQYFTLTRQARGMELPKKEAEAELKYIRDIQFEFTRLKVEVTYGMEWVGHHLMKYLATPLKEVKAGLHSMNDWLQARMPEWSDKIARVMVIAINLIKDMIRLVTDLYGHFKVLWDHLPNWAKTIAVALAIAFAPVSPALKILSALLLLLDDFYAYSDGRKSSKTLAPVWKWLKDAIELVTWNIVLATAMVDNFFDHLQGKGRPFSDVWDDVESAWSDQREGRKDLKSTFIGPKQPRQMNSATSMRNGSDNHFDMVEQSVRHRMAGDVSSSQTSSLSIEIGKVDVNVGGSNASPKDIFQAVRDGIASAGSKLAINTRQTATVRP